MADVLGYLSVALFVLISCAGFYPDIFVNQGKTLRISLGGVLVLAIGLALYSFREGNAQHSKDAGQIDSLNLSVKIANDIQEKNAKLFIQGQKDVSEEFAKKYGDLSNKLAALQTGIETADLRKEADGLRAELKANQKAMVVPKTVLTFSLKNSPTPVLAESLSAHNGIVHLSFLIINTTDIDALDGDVVLYICNACEYATVPPGFVKVSGALDNQRNLTFSRILAHTGLPEMEFDIKVPPSLQSFIVGAKVYCHTCVAANSTNLLPQESATISINRM